MANGNDKPVIRPSEENQKREFIVEYQGDTRGPYSTQKEADDERKAWIDELAEKAEKQQALDEYLKPYTDAIGKIKDRNDRRRENGSGQRESDKRNKELNELEGFEFSYPPIETDVNGPHWFSPFVALPHTPEVLGEWTKTRRVAANAYRKARLNRTKQPKATRAAKESKKAKFERDKQQVAALMAQGKANRVIAHTLGLSVRQVQRLKK